MKRIAYKFLTVLLLSIVPVTLMGHDGKLKGKYTKEKTIKKEFNVNSNALLKIDNSYGNLNLTSWDENRVLIEVHIKTNGNNEEKVKQKLDGITVDFDASSSQVSAKTIFGSSKNGWGWNWGKNNNVNMQINYTIKMPVKNSINLNNDYGNITLDRVDGHAKIKCDYGRLDIGELNGRNNQLKFDYTSRSSIGFMDSGEIKADYSGFTIGKAGNLLINADYTDSNVGEMENLQYSSDYGKIAIGEANNIIGNGDYVSIKLGTIHGNAELTSDYGSLKIENMAADAGNLTVRTDYTSVKIGYSPGYHFDFEIDTEYAGVSGKDDFEINISKEKSTSKYYKGYHGQTNSGNTVYITSDYGGVSFHKN